MNLNTLLIGSSNVSRFYADLDQKWTEDIKFVKCTKIEVLKAILDDTKAEKIIVSVVENFLSDAVENLLVKEKEDVEKAIDTTMKDYLGAIQVFADKLPNTKIALVEPMRRPALPWYETKLEDIIAFHNRCIHKMKRPNVDRINGLLQSSQHFDSFGVHLVPTAGLKFVEMIIANADDLFEMMETDVVEIEDEEMKEVEERNVGKKKEEEKKELKNKDEIKLNVGGLPERTSKLEEQMKTIQDCIAARMRSDNLVFARMREELDFGSNCKREDRILVIGLTSSEERPAAQADLKGWLTKLVGDTLERITKGSAVGVAFVNPMRGGGGGILPICEVRMKTRDQALQIRKDFAAKRKNGGDDLGKLFVANSVTLATRVRLDVMKAIAKICESKNEQMFVRGFSSRPVLQVRQRDGSRPPLTLTFADAVGRYGAKLKDSDLAGAYRRAGRAFAGELEQNFVVLTDPIAVKMGRGEGGPGGRPAFVSAPNKRPLAPGRDQSERKRSNLKKKA
jgi:hypothetical protein